MLKSRSISELFAGPVFPSDFMRHAAARLARLQFRPATFYSTLKPYVPAFALGYSWALVMRERYAVHSIFHETISIRHLATGLSLVVIWNLFCMAFRRVQSMHRRYLQETLPAFGASILCGLALATVHRIWPSGNVVLPASMLVLALLSSYALLLFLSWIVSEHLLPMLKAPKIALVVGTGERGRALLREFADGKRYNVIGTLDDDYVGSDADAHRYLGKISQLESLLKEKPVESVLITLPIGSQYATIQNVIRACEVVGVDSSYMADLFETTLARRQEETPADQPRFITLTMHRPDFRRWFKTGFDISFAFALLILLSPVLLGLAIAVKLSSPGPIFFQQLRYGLHRKRFAMFKFRTMEVDAEARQAELERLNEAEGPVFKIKKDPRITPIGGFLRKMSIDELPQLFNVLRGEMSLVGPRPLPLRDVSKFEESWLLRRFSVKPGLTCLWQASGRSDTSFSDWIRLDLQYIDEWSLALDFKILIMTIPAVLKGRGAS